MVRRVPHHIWRYYFSGDDCGGSGISGAFARVAFVAGSSARDRCERASSVHRGCIYVLGALSVRRPYGCDHIRAWPLRTNRVDPAGECHLHTLAVLRALVRSRHGDSRLE